MESPSVEREPLKHVHERNYNIAHAAAPLKCCFKDSELHFNEKHERICETRGNRTHDFYHKTDGKVEENAKDY